MGNLFNYHIIALTQTHDNIYQLIPVHMQHKKYEKHKTNKKISTKCYYAISIKSDCVVNSEYQICKQQQIHRKAIIHCLRLAILNKVKTQYFFFNKSKDTNYFRLCIMINVKKNSVTSEPMPAFIKNENENFCASITTDNFSYDLETSRSICPSG